MNNNQFKKLCKSLGACEEGYDSIGTQSLEEFWTSCQRADWMLWLVCKMADKPTWPTRQQVVLSACVCAETALQYVQKGELRPATAIETARAWTRGEATIEQVRDAADAADAAYAAADAADAADAAYAAYAAYAATYAAYAATARAKSLAEMADIVRSIITLEVK